ncbi:hypothetical protein POL68_27480 [Stigmatella sp. ncwal1]|uniref:Lipoprotein n=1 Tax=Stigmatella ashevillensis TaxID=2995309 RepID=A0ABT5DEZ2_9BACT|nr:hypothetical protein [Stigmatella ashevillena]MDC0712240.1 hypothetical protein [Stigmatella ashevillena]
MKPCLPLFVSVLVLLAGCGSREEGLHLNLRLAHQSEQEVQRVGEGRRFVNKRGERITLSRAYVTVSSIEIFACPVTGLRHWMQWLSPVGTAHAHSVTDPRRMGTPYVNSLERADGEVLEMQALQPSPGSYCRVRVVFGPADADAEQLPAGGLMLNKTLLLEGEVSAADGSNVRPFKLESAGMASTELPFEALTLSDDAREASLHFTLAYDGWLDDVVWDSAEAAAQALSHVGSSVTLSRQP